MNGTPKAEAKASRVVPSWTPKLFNKVCVSLPFLSVSVFVSLPLFSSLLLQPFPFYFLPLFFFLSLFSFLSYFNLPANKQKQTDRHRH